MFIITGGGSGIGKTLAQALANQTTYVSKEWDIYETDHHVEWLKLPHQVLHWDF